MKQYSKYKDSGVDFIGKIPVDWDVIKVKWAIENLESGRRESESNMLEGGILSIGGEHINHNGNLILENARYISEDYFNLLNSGKIKINDILLVKDGATIGKCCFLDKLPFQKCAVNEHVFLIRTNNYFMPKYFFYFIFSNPGQEQILNLIKGSAQPGLNSTFINYSYIPRFSIQEQEKIITYLDKQTRKLDSLIEKRKHMIELLDEQRSAIINHAVTKGIDPKVKMKDSGIQLLGKIPEHWRLDKLRRVCYMKGRIGWQGLKQSEFIDEGPYLITGMNFKDGKIRWSEVYHITEERYNEAPEIQLKESDVLMTKDGTIGKLLFVENLPGKASLNSHLLLMRSLHGEFTQKYLYLLLHSDYFRSHIDTTKTGTTFFGITQEEMGTFKMLLPPIQEQQQIVKHIEAETSKIDKTLSKIEKEIALLQEYKTALISEAVTGKIDVRGDKNA